MGVLATFNLNAQCTPNTSYTVDGAYPTSLPNACANTAYNETVTLVVTNQQKVNLGPTTYTVDMDSLELTSISNIPPGMNYDCKNPNCRIKIDKSGSKTYSCFVFSGTPTQAGLYTMTVNYKVFVQGFTLSKSTTVDVTINTANSVQCTNVGINEKVNKGNINAFPNPANDFIQFEGSLNNVKLYDALGNQVYSSKSADQISVENLKPGLYFIKSDEGTQRIIVE